MTTAELEQRLSSTSYLANIASSFASFEPESLVDTGSAVPLAITLQAAANMAFQSFSIFASDNPVSQVFTIKLDTPQARFRFETRIRLGASRAFN